MQVQKKGLSHQWLLSPFHLFKPKYCSSFEPSSPSRPHVMCMWVGRMRCICRNMLQIHKCIFEKNAKGKCCISCQHCKAIHHFDSCGRASRYCTVVIMCKKAFQNKKKAVFFCTWFLQQRIDKFNAINTWDDHKLKKKRSQKWTGRFQMDAKAISKLSHFRFLVDDVRRSLSRFRHNLMWHFKLKALWNFIN